ncbi:MAG: cation:proton antiporter [Clostridia bacterium]|nr:cation:proton antiporter [Clostridia bacterium]
MDILFCIALSLLLGLLVTRIIKPIGLPAVTGYLISGIILGPYCLGRIGLDGLGFTSAEYVSRFKLISDVALGFIAFSIGNEFRVESLKKTGRQTAVIGVFQAITATVFVDLSLCAASFFLGQDVFPYSAAITLGAVATATAPAATLMVVKQYKAKGPLTDLLLPIVALDDAVGLIVFAVSFGIAKAMTDGTTDFVSIIVNPLIEIVVSLAVGALVGFVFSWVERFFHSRSKRLSVSVTFVLLTVALTMVRIKIGPVVIGMSSLLTCMMLGTIFCNVCESSEELMERVDRWTTPLFVLFFVISGAELELDIFTSSAVVIVGVIYLVFRSAGKIFGAGISSKFMKCDKKIVDNLGITLLPQAGVALGMAVTAVQLGPYVGGFVRNIILFSVLVYEIVGPMLTKMALIRAGEVVPEERKSNKIINEGGQSERHSNKT